MIEKLKDYLLSKKWKIKGSNDKFIGLQPPRDLGFDDYFTLYIPITNKLEKKFIDDFNEILLDLYGTSLEEITENKKEIDITFLTNYTSYTIETKPIQLAYQQFFNYLGWSNEYIVQKKFKNSYLFKIGKEKNSIFDFMICDELSDFNKEINEYNQSIKHYKPKISIFTYQYQWKILFNEFDTKMFEIEDIRNQINVFNNLIDVLKKDNIENNIYYTFSKFLIIKNLDDNLNEMYNIIKKVLIDINNMNDNKDIFKKFIIESSNFSSQKQLKNFNTKILEFKKSSFLKNNKNDNILKILKNLYKKDLISFFDVCSFSNSDINEIENLCKQLNLDYKDIENE